MTTNGSLPWPQAISQAQLLFNKCININPSNYNGQRVLAIVRGYGNWPVSTPGWNAPTQNAWYLQGLIQSKYGVGTLMPGYVDLDYRQNYRHMLWLTQASLTYPAIYYNTPSTADVIRRNLVYLMTRIAATMAQVQGTNPSTAQIAQDVTDMVNFEFLLANASIPSSQQRNASQQYNIFNLQQANARWPNLQFSQYFRGGLSPLNAANQSIVQARFGVDFPAFYDRLNTFIQPGSERLLQNYLIWRLIYPYMEFLPAFRVHFEEFKRNVDGIDALADPSVSCIQQVTSYMPFAAGRLYVDNHFNTLPGMPRNKLRGMIMSVLGAFRTMISQLTWMDMPNKIMAINKVNGIVQNVAYPDWAQDNNKLNAKYAGLKLGAPDNFWTVMQKLTSFNQLQGFQLLYKSVNRADFSGSPAIVNAWYQPQYNSITFPAGILNPPFFEADFPAAVNYGGMGVVMGHELTHGFDDQGVQWNQNGTLSTWMDAYSQAGFKQMAQCIINEYSNFCFPSLPPPNCVSGVRTQGENIADNGGIKSAYIAFKANQILDGTDPSLPGYMGKYTQDQLFFMAFGQVWCRNIKLSAIPQQLLLDPHAPARDRVLGTVKNFPQFGKAFNCPLGSPMYPKNHCNVW
jgi:predicted metalloendopeptidase